jgi:hypothetical protein
MSGQSGGGQSGGSSAGGGAAGGDSSSGGIAGGASSMMSGQSGGPGTPSLNFGKSQPASSSNSNNATAKNSSRHGGGRGGKGGNNWALPAAQGKSIGVTRPLRVSVLPDRIVIVPDKTDSRPVQTLMISPVLTTDEVNRFVKMVQREIDGWGLAVADGYWKPVLKAEVAPEGEANFAHLQYALNGSGFDLVRKTP